MPLRKRQAGCDWPDRLILPLRMSVCLRYLSQVSSCRMAAWQPCIRPHLKSLKKDTGSTSSTLTASSTGCFSPSFVASPWTWVTIALISVEEHVLSCTALMPCSPIPTTGGKSAVRRICLVNILLERRANNSRTCYPLSSVPPIVMSSVRGVVQRVVEDVGLTKNSNTSNHANSKQ